MEQNIAICLHWKKKIANYLFQSNVGSYDSGTSARITWFILPRRDIQRRGFSSSAEGHLKLEMPEIQDLFILIYIYIAPAVQRFLCLGEGLYVVGCGFVCAYI